MKKTVLLLISCLLLNFSTKAQDATRNQKVTVTFQKLNYTSKNKKPNNAGEVIGQIASVLLTNQTSKQLDGYESAVQAAIIKGMTKARRVIALDGADGAPVTTAKAYNVEATLANISTTTRTNFSDDKKSSYTSYRGIINVTLLIKDPQTGEVKASPTFDITDSDYSWVKSSEGAINNALASLSKQVTEWFNIWLPLRANIVEGARAKKDKQKEVYIDLGAREGAVANLHMGVFTVKLVAGKEALKQIGRLRIEEVEGDDISLCKVQSGGRDIKEALDAGATILVKSTD